MNARKPSAAAIVVAAIPFAAMCFSVAWWDRIDPRIFGLPFNMMWLLCWIVLSSLCVWTIYRLERGKPRNGGGK
jgi:hypothetical protein